MSYQSVLNDIEKTFPLEIECPKCGEKLIRDEDDYDLLKIVVKEKLATDATITANGFLFFFHPSIKYKCSSCGYYTEANRHGLVYK